MRTFVGESLRVDDGLNLALAPALTPAGLDSSPSFFHGFATHPLVLASGLVTLADITRTRYFQFDPTAAQRDPILTAHGDRLRAECFSACNGVYARLDLLSDGLDGGEIGYGTTNVDISPDTRRALLTVERADLFHLDVGIDGLKVATLDAQATERPVDMPARWVPALGNLAALHRDVTASFTLDATQTKTFVAPLPAATATAKTAWVVPGPRGVKVTPRTSADGVRIAGLNRLSALKRLLPHLRGSSWYTNPDTGISVVEVDLPGARLTIGLTDEGYRGHSGEGSLLVDLVDLNSVEDAELISLELAFEPRIDIAALSRASGLDEGRVSAAISVLAASGRVGWDQRDERYFHRELPDDPDRVTRDNPRVVGARQLVDHGAVRPADRPGQWLVGQDGRDYLVTTDPAGCTCTWFLRHGTGRGMCKHQLAAQLVNNGAAGDSGTRSDTASIQT